MTFLGFLTLSQPLDTVRTSARGWGQPRPSAPAGGSTCPAKARGGHLPAWSVTGPGHLLALLSWPERQTGEVSLREQAPENHLARGLGQQMQEEQAALMTAGPRWGPWPPGAACTSSPGLWCGGAGLQSGSVVEGSGTRCPAPLPSSTVLLWRDAGRSRREAGAGQALSSSCGLGQSCVRREPHFPSVK